MTSFDASTLDSLSASQKQELLTRLADLPTGQLWKIREMVDSELRRRADAALRFTAR